MEGGEIPVLQALTFHYALGEHSYKEDLAQYIFIAYIT